MTKISSRSVAQQNPYPIFVVFNKELTEIFMQNLSILVTRRFLLPSSPTVVNHTE